MIHIFEADGIILEFGSRKILSDIYIKCETGEITGFLGRNGRGKTCLMNIIYGSLKPKDKSIRFDNTTIFQAFKRPDLITYLPQNNFIPTHLSLKRIFSDYNLDYKEFENIFPEFNPQHNSILKNLSGGERQVKKTTHAIQAGSKTALLEQI